MKIVLKGLLVFFILIASVYLVISLFNWTFILPNWNEGSKQALLIACSIISIIMFFVTIITLSANNDNW